MNLKKELSATVVLSLLITSCSSLTPPEKSKAHIEISEKISVRAPSSSESEENLSRSFALLMNAENPEKEFLDYLSGFKSIYLRAEAYLADFDHELDNAVAGNSGIQFDTSKSYKKLIVMYTLSHRLKNKITYHYLSLTDMVYDKSLPVEKRKLAKTILSKFKKKLDSKDPIEKISFDELKYEIAQSLRERQGILSSTSKPTGLTVKSKYEIAQSLRERQGVYSSTSKLAGFTVNNFKSENEKVSVLRRYRKNMREIGKIETESGDELSQKVDAISDQLQFVDTSGREPKSELTFFPSVTSSGNIMGLAFPKGVWALTYDDGPSPIHTTEIAKNLENLGVKATFFWLAENVVRYQSIVDMIGEKGHARANHSWSHAQLPKLDGAGLQKEIVQSTAVEEKAYGEKVKFFRCPYGAGNSVPRIRQMIANLNMIHVFWNVDTLDWQDKDPESIVARSKKQMRAAGHGVVLFHDIHPQSVIASKKLVEWSKTFKGTVDEIRWVTLPEIVNEMNGVKKN